MNNVRRFAIGLVIACSAAILAAEALPTVTFENFSQGSPNGQFGWKSTGSAGQGCAIYDHMIALNDIDYFPAFKRKSLRISNAITSDCFHDQTFSAPVTQEAGETTDQPYFVFEFDFASTRPDSQQPGLKVALSADNGEGARMSWIEVADAAGGLEVTFTDYQDGFVSTTFATGLHRTSIHHVRVEHYFYDGPHNDVVIVNVDNGAFVHRGTSWEDFYRTDPQQQPPVARSILFHTRTTRGAAPDTLYFGFKFDNVEQASGPIPVGPPSDKNECKKGGWRAFNNPAFRNQGQCVSHVEAHEHDRGHGRGGDDDHDRHHDPDDGHNDNHDRDDGHGRRHKSS